MHVDVMQYQWLAWAALGFSLSLGLIIAMVDAMKTRNPHYALELDKDRKGAGWGDWYWIVDTREEDEAKRHLRLLDASEAPRILAEMNGTTLQ